MLKIELFTKWLKEGGAKLDPVRMKYYGPDYRGVHSCKIIKPNDIILKIPENLIITPQRGRDTPIGKLVMESNIHIVSSYLFYLTLFFLEQFHDPNSFWKPYLNVYPKSISSFPFFYSKEEKEMLTGSSIVEDINIKKKELIDEYEKIAKAVPQFRKYTLEEYMKNKVLIVSRVFLVKIKGKEERIMVPFADMFNYHKEKVGETFWKYDDTSESFVVSAKRGIPIGEAVQFKLFIDM